MESQIILTCDSTADLSKELYERYDIHVIPLKVILGDITYQDGIDIQPEDIYKHHAETGELPKTASTNIDDYLTFFRPFVEAGKTVIHFTVCPKMSSSYNNASIAAKELGNVYVVDSNNLSTGTGLLLLAAADRVKTGMSAEEIVREVEALAPNTDASFTLDSLDYLHKGGRCSALAVLGANLLKIKPCIQVQDGVMGVTKKYRGKFSDVVLQYAEDKLANPDDIVPDRIFVTHAGCDKAVVDSVVSLVQKKLPHTEVLVTRAGCTISSHCGKNCLGVLFVAKSPLL